MNYYSLNKISPNVTFKEATIKGQAPDKGLYFPSTIPTLSKDLIANYRFDTNGNDLLGRNSPFVVTTEDFLRLAKIAPFFTVTNSPFSNGVLYVNGRYEPNGHFAHYLGTDIIKDLRYDSFSVSFDFYPLPRKRGMSSLSSLEQKLDLWTRGRYSRWRGFDQNVFRTDNILTGGYHYRWFGINREDGFLHITLNNQAFVSSIREGAR